jgi:tetratricopeptide (TPR) repeat protein
MSAYVYIELPAPLNEWIAPPDAVFPVLAGDADALQRPGAPQPELILLQLERYLEEFPERQSRFATAGGQLAFRTAVELFTSGLKEAALQFYELALRLQPEHLPARVNYAIALHGLCYRDAALAQYGEIMRRTSPREHLRIWILAAQIHFLRDEFRQVVDLLEPLQAEVFPEDPQFWDLLGDSQAALVAKRGDEPTAGEPRAAACPSCGQAARAGMRFCGYCGAKLA